MLEADTLEYFFTFFCFVLIMFIIIFWELNYNVMEDIGGSITGFIN